MTHTVTVACVQNCASDDTNQSLEECHSLIERASLQGAELICLPEFCSHFHVTPELFDTGPQVETGHSALQAFSAQAKELGCWLLIGSVAVMDEAGKLRNRSVLINALGEIFCRYDKIHMFDVMLGNGEEYRESDTFNPGSKAILADTPLGKLGLSICYDLRFAGLYRTLAQQGAEILTVPAAFMHTTGKAHWHVLLRSRAIETGSFVVAPCQYGLHGKAKTYGHSLIINPWGEIMAEAGDDQDVIVATLDLAEVISARSRVPALKHDREYEV
ncbi:MAG: putative amidohydrolase [Parasphingorhabdus sp.]|jgi:predicted amidohydrolase